ncbi:hypothetical protein TNCV_1903591 [Trichonephila clavipes]|nr:hypothetical protein TNCV_1903591 [Trichonephila clavipes]
MWFVSEEFFSGAAQFKGFKSSPLSLLRRSAVGLLESSYILLVAEKGSLGGQRLRERYQAGSRNNFLNATAKCTCGDYFDIEADSQLGGGNLYTI